MNKKIIWGVIVLIAVIIIIGVSRNNSPTTSGPVRIGGLFNLVGFATFAGESSRDGFIMAVEDSGLKSDQLETIIEDGRSDAKSIVSAATKLSEIDRVIAVIGPEFTEFGEVVAPIAERSKTPFISPWIVAEQPFIKPPYFWSASPSFRGEHTALAGYLAKNGINNISFIGSKNAWSYADTAMFKEEAAKYPSIKFLSQQDLDQTTRDFRTAIAKIKAENPDLIYCSNAEDEGFAVFVSQVRQAGITTPIAAFSGRVIAPVLRDRYANVLPGLVFAQSVDSKRANEFNEKYEKRFGKKVGAPSAAAAYDLTTVVIDAIKGGARTSAEISDYLLKMPAFEGYSGTIKYDENGRLPWPVAVVKKFNAQGIAEIVQ